MVKGVHTFGHIVNVTALQISDKKFILSTKQGIFSIVFYDRRVLLLFILSFIFIVIFTNYWTLLFFYDVPHFCPKCIFFFFKKRKKMKRKEKKSFESDASEAAMALVDDVTPQASPSGSEDRRASGESPRCIVGCASLSLRSPSFVLPTVIKWTRGFSA